MALRKAARKADGKKLKAKNLSPKTKTKAAAPVRRTAKAHQAEKRSTAAVRGRTKPEPPAVDHAAKLGPLYLGAGHGHLSRPVDKAWNDALSRYCKTLSEAVEYEGQRSATARAAAVTTLGRQAQTLMANIGTRVTTLVQETQSTVLDPGARQQARHAAAELVAHLVTFNTVLGQMVGSHGIAPFGDAAVPPAQQQALEQMQRAHLNNIARYADLERLVATHT